jgi:hypothetical protein
MSLDAMKQALEALEEVNKLSIGENAICLPAEIDGAMDALRERLAQPDHHDPIGDAQDKLIAEQAAQPQMQPCAGRNCGSTNPNLHSAECFEDYEKATGMHQWQGLTDDEIKEIIGPWGETPIKGYIRKLFDQIEAKLKEKNT